jgi:hypothetical protein
LFNKDPSTARPIDLPLSFSSENPLPSVRVTIILIILQPITDIPYWLVFQDLYPDYEVDAELSDGDNIGQKEPTGDDAEGEGAPSVETLALNPIGSSIAEESHPSATDRTTTAAPSGVGKRKNMLRSGLSTSKTKLHHVIIELPLYRGPRSPLHLVVIEHIFGRLFEAFQLVSQALRTGTGWWRCPAFKKGSSVTAEEDDVPKYTIILLVYSSFNFDLHSDIMVVHRKSLASGQPKSTFAQVTSPTTTASVAVAASSSVGGIGWIVLSIADIWDSSRHVTKFLEGLKNWEANREGTPSFLCYFNPLEILN